MTLPEECVIEQISIQSGRGEGARHEEELTRRAVGVALHDHRAVFEMRKERGSNVRVVLEEVPFGQAELRPEQLLQVRQANGTAGEEELDVFGVRWNPHPTHGTALTPTRGQRREPFGGVVVGGRERAAFHRSPGSFGGREPRRTAPRTGR